MNNFGKEIGSISENLVLATSGKIKIRYGNKYIDLLDNKGNIKVPSIISKDSNKDNGLFVKDGILYYTYNGETKPINTNIDDEYVSYKKNQTLTEEEKKLFFENIGLTTKLEEIEKILEEKDKEIQELKNIIQNLK